jgi:hypothetical protein
MPSGINLTDIFGDTRPCAPTKNKNLRPKKSHSKLNGIFSIAYLSVNTT